VIRDTGWYKSSFSAGGNDTCVEVRIIDSGAVGLRDSKYPAGQPLWVRPAEWAIFLAVLTR
jgi:hypothetical protein